MLWVPSAYRHPSVDLTAASVRNATAGITVTASATPHTKGSWSPLVDPVPFDVYAIDFGARDVNSGATNTSMLLDLGIGPTGGGNEQVIIPDVNIWGATVNWPFARSHYWPIYLKAGTRLSARNQALIASDTCTAHFVLHCQPLLEFRCQRWTAYGVDAANSRGTAVTAGNGSFGSWTQIVASTTRDHYLWHVGVDYNTDTGIAAGAIYVNFGYGPNSSSVTQIGAAQWHTSGSTEDILGPFPNTPFWCPVPSGSALFARVRHNEATGRNVIIYAGD